MLIADGVMNHPVLGMLKKLEKYYLEQRISAIAFKCENFSECSAGCKEGDFVTAREAFVGSEYEKDFLPRLLFISLDASDEWPGSEPENRTLQAVRTEVESGQTNKEGYPLARDARAGTWDSRPNCDRATRSFCAH